MGIDQRWLAVLLAFTLVVVVSQASGNHSEGHRYLRSSGLRKRSSFKNLRNNERSDDAAVTPKRRLTRGNFSNLKIGAFNIQIFGRAKMSNQDVADILVEIVLRYDVILIMEIRDITGTAINDLLNRVNRAAGVTTRSQTNGNKIYNKIISPRLGRSANKEQYAFLYRTDKVSVVRHYVYDDGDKTTGIDTFEREPLVVHFRSSSTRLTDLVFVAIHTSPKAAPAEIDALVDVYDDVRAKWSRDDVIIMGDFNAACDYMSDSDWRKNRLFNDKRFTWLIKDCVDTTVGGHTCAYDRFVSAGSAMNAAVVPGTADRFKFDSKFNITHDLAKEVSDHYPIELEFYSQGFSNTLQSVREVVEYKFYSKNPPRLTSKSIYPIGSSSNPLFSQRFIKETHKASSGAIATITNAKKVTSDQDASQALSMIYSHWSNLLNKDQVDMALYKVANKEFHKKSLVSAVVKFVCRKIPTPVECWVALEL